MKIPFIDLTRQYKNLKPDIDKVVKDTFSRGDFILGENVTEFEKKFASFCGVKYCVGVASGTDALLLSLRALNVGEGDEVITTSFTFIATVLPILYLGAKPILVDINPDTYQIDTKKLEKVITKKTKAIIPVHLFGIPAPMGEITKIAKKHKVYVVEDACQAHGSEINGKRCGSFGEVGAFSFYPTKSLGAPGDAGAIVTNNKKLANKIRVMRNVGRVQPYKHNLLGYNSRLDTIHAGVLLIKLKNLEKWNAKRKSLARLYDKLLTDLPIVLPPGPTNGLSPNHYVYVVRIKNTGIKNRDKLFEFLTKSGISCAVYYPIPIHLQKALSELGYTRGDFPVAERAAQEVMALPLYPELKQAEVKYICSRIREFFRRGSK